MTSTVARVHSHTSHRKSAVKSKPDEQKVVYRSVMDNPYEIEWPIVPLNVQTMILAQTTELLSDVSNYVINRKLASRKRKRKTGKSTASKVSRTNGSNNDTARGPDADHATLTLQDESSGFADPSTADDSQSDPPKPPSIMSHVLFGINEVTKRLERQIDFVKNPLLAPSEPVPICLVVACVEDLETPVLVAHLPQLIAACNWTGAHKDRSPLKLVPLPKGAESTLANASGLRRTSVIAFEDCKDAEPIRASLDSVPALIAPWLTSSSVEEGEVISGSYEVTHVKQLRTTAPKNMKAAKESRAMGVAQAKLRKQSVVGP